MISSPNRIQRSRGFTLLELMITVALIAIIASIAIPSYINYTKKTHFSELIRATAPYKLGVVECYNTQGSFANCNSGPTTVNGIPPSITAPPNEHSAIGKISVKSGVITAEPNPISGLKANETYILTPTANNGVISWVASGKAIDAGLIK